MIADDFQELHKIVENEMWSVLGNIWICNSSYSTNIYPTWTCKKNTTQLINLQNNKKEKSVIQDLLERMAAQVTTIVHMVQ